MNKKQEQDKILEVGGVNYSLRRILDSEESWNKYINGSDKFKAAVELGVVLQIVRAKKEGLL